MITNPPFAAWARQGRSWIPRDEPSCGVWLRADLGVSLGSGGRVAGWANQAAWGQTFSQGTLTKQPTYSATGFGSTSMPSLGFSASNTTSLAQSVISQAAADYTFIFACNPTATSSAQGLWLMDVVTGRIICTQHNTVNQKVAYFDGTTYRGTGNPTTGAQILSFQLTATNLGAIYRNGAALDSPGLTWTQKALSGAITIGSANGGTSSFFQGSIAEIAILRNPDSGARSRVEKYMGRRYGITVV